MISLSSSWAIALRYLHLLRRDHNFLLSIFYWPLLDILTWGFLGAWIQKTSGSQLHHYETVALLGILLWQVVGRGCNIVAFTLCEELWRENLCNMFSMPLRITEWMCGILLFTAIMIILTFLASIITIYLFYDVSLMQLITTYFLFLPPLFLCCIWIGFTCLQIIILMGRRGVELAFIFAWFLTPFCGVFYPIDVLPNWAQKLSAVLPMSYIFQGMRASIMEQQNPTPYLMKGYILGFVYATFAVLFFVYCFNRSKRNGLARLAN